MYPNTKYKNLSNYDLLPHVYLASRQWLIDSNVSIDGAVRAEVVTLLPQWLAIYARQSSCCELPLQCVNSSDAVLAAIPPLEAEEKQTANSL
jgi:hypothetical protein